MRHEPSDSCVPVQQTADRRCPSCRAVKPPEDFLDRAGTPAGCCAPCRRRRAAVARRCQQRALRQVARHADAGYRALLAHHSQGGGGDAA
jgi:hypothetical protein